MIKKARFITDGCGAMIAVASQTIMMIEGKTIKESEILTADQPFLIL